MGVCVLQIHGPGFTGGSNVANNLLLLSVMPACREDGYHHYTSRFQLLFYKPDSNTGLFDVHIPRLACLG